MKELSRGILVALEGIDGSGKSTLAKNLATYFNNQEFSVFLTQEPGGSPLGKIMRTLVQEQKTALCPSAEFLIFAADRAQHFDEIIIPALQQKKLIISDRLADSSLAYQGFGRGLNIVFLEQVNHWAMHGIKPDLTLYVKVSFETALKRLAQRGKSLSVFEQNKTFFQKALEGFNTLYKDRTDVIMLDGEQEAQEVERDARGHINTWLINHKI
jgi:dTMP kinase